MRKLLLSAILLSFGFAVTAQKLDDVQEKISKGKYGEAKEKIDEILKEEKGQKTANAWYYKGVIYNALASDANAAPGIDYRLEAFNALKRYQEMDPKNILMTLEQNARLFQIYEGFFNVGVKHYNEKNYDAAFSTLKNALAVKDYIYGKKFTYGDFAFTALDTQLLDLTGTAALLAKKEDESVPYFTMLADAKLKGDNYKEIYPFLVDYYNRKKDLTNRNKYLAIGSELYPQDDYWLQVQLNDAGEDEVKIFAKYDELLQNNPNSFFLNYNYAVELFNSIYSTDKKLADYKQRQEKLNSLLKRSLELKNTPEVNLLIARARYNEIYDKEDEVIAIKGTKPEDIKKKQAINAEISKMYDDMLPFAQATYDAYEAKATLKPSETGNFKIAADILSRYYTAKKQTDKAKQYQDKVKSL
jgi:hypothetical protein